MSRIAKIAIAATIALGSLGAGGAAWAQQLNGQQAVQFLTSKPNLRTSAGTVETWKRDMTYQFRRGNQRPTSGAYTVDNSGNVCWRARDGASGCFVVGRDAQGYYGRGSRGGTWRYQ